MSLSERVMVRPLGAGMEVGRSCIHVRYKDTELLLDCGVHPAHTGVASLPFLDLVDLSKIDAVLITHFHLDHAAALPFLTEKTAFTGKVYMTHPTKAILRWLLNDYIRVINSSSEQDFYSEEDLERCYSRIIPIDYHQEITLKSFRFTALNAGHVLGAAMFLFKLEDSFFLYTGDFSREEDRHLRSAESPGCSLDALITESTYGVQCHLSRTEREERFTSVVSSVLERGGRCLLPVFALGRAQELLLILEEYWEANPRLHNIPIYYVSALARKCMVVYQTYANMMNERIQSMARNPFDFKHVSHLKDVLSFEDSGPCVVLASPGMLQSGFSRELFERWCASSANGVVIPGYCVDGTLAKEILSEPKEVESMRGGTLRLAMTVEYISFSAHVDFLQNSQFIEECSPSNLFFVHGEMNEMMRLRNTIAQRNERSGREMALYTLRNGEEGSFNVVRCKRAAVYVDKASETPFCSVIIDDSNSENRGFKIYSAENLEQCEIQRVQMKQEQRIPLGCSAQLVKILLHTEFGVQTGDDEKDDGEEMLAKGLAVGGVRVCLEKNDITDGSKGDVVVLKWEAGYLDDVIAASISRAIRGLGEGVRSIRVSKLGYMEAIHERIAQLYPQSALSRNDDGGILIRVQWQDMKAEISEGGITGDAWLVEKLKVHVDRIRRVYF